MNKEYKLFFEVIQVALGNRSALSKTPSDNQWQKLYSFAEIQALVGVCFAAIEKLPKNQTPYMDLLMDWLGQAEYIKTVNQTVNHQCFDVLELLKKEGLESCVIKGQGVAESYGDLSQYRVSGDIDIWTIAPVEDVLRYVSSRTPNREFDAKHTHLNIFSDTIVEIHWKPTVGTSPSIRRNMAMFYKSQGHRQCSHLVTIDKINNIQISAPDPFFNSIYILLHIYNHYLYEGIGLRQFMDYYFACIQNDVQDRRVEIIGFYKEFGVLRFSRSVMWVLQEVFGMDDNYLLVEPDAKGGRELLDEIMEGGNFGHASAENQVKNESTAHRWFRRARRKIRLLKYNPIGVFCNPFYKIWLGLWKRKVIKMYKL